ALVRAMNLRCDCCCLPEVGGTKAKQEMRGKLGKFRQRPGVLWRSGHLNSRASCDASLSCCGVIRSSSNERGSNGTYGRNGNNGNGDRMANGRWQDTSCGVLIADLRFQI